MNSIFFSEIFQKKFFQIIIKRFFYLFKFFLILKMIIHIIYNLRVKLNLPITECYKQAEIVAEINIAVDSIDKRLSKVENLITNLAVKDNNQELSPAQLVLTKLANVLVQIISIIVMLVSSFADVIIGLDKNLKLFIIISFLLYMLLGLLKPALTIFF